MRHYLILPAVCGLLLVGSCTSQSDKQLQRAADEMAPCDKVNALLQAQQNGFSNLRGRSLSEKVLGIWAARIHAVGKDCQVWQLGSETTYMCARSAPNQEVVMEWYENSLQQLAQCVNDWERSDADIAEDGSRKVLWSKTGVTPVIAMQAVPVSRSLRSGRWTLYYYMGTQQDWY